MGGMAARLDVSANCEVAHATEQGQDVHSGLTCSLQLALCRWSAQSCCLRASKLDARFRHCSPAPSPPASRARRGYAHLPSAPHPSTPAARVLLKARRQCTTPSSSTPCTCCRPNAEQSWGLDACADTVDGATPLNPPYPRHPRESRRLNYKNKGQFRQDELKKKREEQQVEIRKQKREESIAKRRNLQAPSGAAGADSDDDDAVATQLDSQVCLLFLAVLPVGLLPAAGAGRLQGRTSAAWAWKTAPAWHSTADISDTPLAPGTAAADGPGRVQRQRRCTARVHDKVPQAPLKGA